MFEVSSKLVKVFTRLVVFLMKVILEARVWPEPVRCRAGDAPVTGGDGVDTRKHEPAPVTDNITKTAAGSAQSLTTAGSALNINLYCYLQIL